MFEIEFYKLRNGKKPAKEFIESLNVKMRVKALDSLEILEDKGNELREPYSKYIEDGVFELRIKFSTDITRLFYFFFMGKKIIITNGYVKKDNKLKRKELAKAKKYKKDFGRRKE